MEDTIDLEVEDSQQETNRPNNRYKDLADKYRAEREEKERIAQEKAALEAEKLASQKEVEFYKTFSSLSGKYQGASDYQDKIREKVLSGYDIEDATISVLAKEGKLTNAPVREIMPAGGSATNTITPTSNNKSPSEMSLDEMRAALIQAEAKGDISLS